MKKLVLFLSVIVFVVGFAGKSFADAKQNGQRVQEIYQQLPDEYKQNFTIRQNCEEQIVPTNDEASVQEILILPGQVKGSNGASSEKTICKLNGNELCCWESWSPSDKTCRWVIGEI